MEFLALIGAVVVVLIVVGLLSSVYAIWQGWVLSILWGWFAVPIFHLPRISVSAAIGIALIFGVLTHQQHTTPKNQTAGEKTASALTPFIAGAVALLIGRLVRL